MPIDEKVREDLENALVCIDNVADAIEYNDFYEAYTSLLEAIAFVATRMCEIKDLKEVFNYLYKAWREAYESMDLEQVADVIIENVMNAKGILKRVLNDAVEP
ncbi:MAG: hypothetical protein DRN30_00420 [Thermoplasmata archaeon]|nr:hypothetical protein [Euryarchaeota archaeon]RLF67238.1 MAG: hypothetical protein DRN30_00420 [Thermoplasmata archaeon]